MEATETQVDISAQFLPGSMKVAPEAPKETPEAPKEAPVAATPEIPEATATPETPEAPVTSVNDPEDPYAKIVEDSLRGPEADVSFTDEELAKIEKVVGTKDLKAFAGTHSTVAEKASMLEAQVSELSAIKSGLEALPPAMRRAFDMVMEGKADKAHEFLRELPEGVFLNKEAKHIPSDKLIPTYLENKMSEEDFAVLKDPDADPDEVKAIKAKEKHYRDIASDMHERKRQEVLDAKKVEDEARQAHLTKYNEGVAQSWATVKNSPYKALADQAFQQEFQSGAWTRAFVQEDGVTPTSEAAMLLLKARHHDKVVKAQFDAGYKRGKADGEKGLVAQGGSLPPTASRQSPAQGGGQAMTVEEQILSRLGKQAATGSN